MRPRHLGVLVALLAVLSACSAGGTGAGASKSPTTSPSATSGVGTQIVSVRPTLPDRTLKPDYVVTSTETSVSACSPYDTDGVVRCDTSLGEHDFCWRLRTTASPLATMACLDQPWTKAVTVLRVPKSVEVPTPDPTTSGKESAVALSLVGGRMCQALFGGLDSLTNAVDSPLVTYDCGTSTVLYGEVTKSVPHWTIGSAAVGQNSYTRGAAVRIATAYFVQADS